MAKKLYYKIGEACKRLDIQPYVLRYWETEFPLLAPSKSSSGQRVYSDQDLRVIQRIKELLYEEGYTIAGAKKKLEKADLGNLAEVGASSEKRPPRDEPEAETESEPVSKPKAKTPRKAKPKTKAKAKAKAASATPSAVEARLRRGIREALKESRAILEILDSD